jgi:hypothetical protein
MRMGIRRSLWFVWLMGMGLMGGARAQAPWVEDWQVSARRGVVDHYIGKIVRLRLDIPGTAHGLLIENGVLRPARPGEAAAVAFQGEEVSIRRVLIRKREVELVLARSVETPRRTIRHRLMGERRPRVTLRYEYELNRQDLQVERLDRQLAQVFLPIGEETLPTGPLLPAGDSAQATGQVEIGGELLPGGDYGELMVDCDCPPAVRARLYLDGAYSGSLPQTVVVTGGGHTVAVWVDERVVWERQIEITRGRAHHLRVLVR